MKNSNNGGFDQHYNVQVAVDQDSLLIVGHTLSNHPVDTYEAIPTVDAIPQAIGRLARLWEGQSKREQARQILSETYNWFTEGFDSHDLREAEALLVALEEKQW